MDWFPYGNGLCHERVKQVNADWVMRKCQKIQKTKKRKMDEKS